MGKRSAIILLLSLSLLPLQAQEKEAEEGSSFEWGITAGVHFPGDSSASFYNGNAPGDRIRERLGWKVVRQEIKERLKNDFQFLGYTPAGEMSYNSSYGVGLNARYIPSEDAGVSIQGELLYSRLKTENVFYLAVDDPGQAVDERRSYSINGREDRVYFSLNLHKEGDGEHFRPFFRVGGTIGYAEASRNEIRIEGLEYSVLPSSDPRYGNPDVQRGIVHGGQGELGLKVRTGKDWDLSLSGRLIYAKIPIGKAPGFDFHGGIYFRLIRTGT